MRTLPMTEPPGPPPLSVGMSMNDFHRAIELIRSTGISLPEPGWWAFLTAEERTLFAGEPGFPRH